MPAKAGTHYFFMRNDGTQNQSVLYVSDDSGSERHACCSIRTRQRGCDRSRLSEYTPSPDGSIARLRAVRRRHGLADLEFRRAADGTDLPDTLAQHEVLGRLLGARQLRRLLQPLSARRSPDGKGDDAGRPDVYFHKLGEPQEQDRLVYKVTDHPTRVPSGARHRRRPLSRHHAVRRHASPTASTSLGPRSTPNAKPRTLFVEVGRALHLHRREGRRAYFQTTNDAPRGRVIAVECEASRRPPRGARSCREADIALDSGAATSAAASSRAT